MEDIPLANIMPFGEKTTHNAIMSAILPTDRKIAEFVLMQDNYTTDANSTIKGLGLLPPEIFKYLVAEAMSKTMDINMDQCNVVA